MVPDQTTGARVLRAVGWSALFVAALGWALPYSPGSHEATAVGSVASLDPASRAAAGARIVARAIHEHGGLDAWAERTDVRFETTWTRYADDRPALTSRYVVRFPTDTLVSDTLVEGKENGERFQMGVAGSDSWFVVGDRSYSDEMTLDANRSFVDRARGLLSLPFRLQDGEHRFSLDGVEMRAGMPVDRVHVTRGDEDLGFFLFDKESGRLSGIGSAVAGPPGRTIASYEAYERVEGILIPTRQVFTRVDPVSGAPSRTVSVRVDSVTFGDGFPAGGRIPAVGP